MSLTTEQSRLPSLHTFALPRMTWIATRSANELQAGLFVGLLEAKFYFD